MLLQIRTLSWTQHNKYFLRKADNTFRIISVPLRCVTFQICFVFSKEKHCIGLRFFSLQIVLKRFSIRLGPSELRSRITTNCVYRLLSVACSLSNLNCLCTLKMSLNPSQIWRAAVFRLQLNKRENGLKQERDLIAFCPFSRLRDNMLGLCNHWNGHLFTKKCYLAPFKVVLCVCIDAGNPTRQIFFFVFLSPF